MSASNVALLRNWIEAFNTHNIEALVELCEPGVELQSTFAAVEGGTYHGHLGIRAWQRDLREAWGDQIRLAPEVYFCLGEHTLGFFVLHGRGQGSGVEVAMPNATVTTWHEGRVVYFKAYARREDALRDLGVTEVELEPIEP
jgi:hypothetical protein